MNKKEITALRRKLEGAIKNVAKQRDELRLIASDAEELADTCDDAERDLQSAIDALIKLA